MRRLLATLTILMVLAAVAIGCGSDESGGSSGSGVAGCLSSEEVRKEVDRIAEGIESSSEDVEAKQQAIQAVESEAC